MAKKQALPTMENQVHPDITAAAEEYVKARDARVRASRKELDRRDVLFDLMEKHKEQIYEDHDAGLRVEILEGDKKIKVRRIEDGSEQKPGKGEEEGTEE